MKGLMSMQRIGRVEAGISEEVQVQLEENMCLDHRVDGIEFAQKEAVLTK